MALGSKIFWAMMTIIALSFVATLVVAFQTSNRQDELYNEQRLERKERAIERSLSYLVDGVDLEASDSERLALLLNDRICELAEIHDLTIAIYTLDGLKITSSSLEGTRYRIPPQVLGNLFVAERGDEDLGWDVDLGEAVEAYLPFRDGSGEPLAIVGLNYEKRQVEGADFFAFFKGLAPVYAALFMMTTALAVFLTQTITRPIRQLTIGLGRLDPDRPEVRPLRYGANDDIGRLVNEYNTLQNELVQKVEELSRRERESAWRTMAMQVAHEIKNPLTPIRLGLQQLVRSWTDQRADFSDRLHRFEDTASAQIEVLNTIASDFALLAELNPKLGHAELADLRTAASDALGLWSAGHPNVDWQQQWPEDPVMVRGKQTHLTRVLNNLLSNALHAVEQHAGTKRIAVSISHLPSGQIRCRIADSGPGIPLAERSRIFEPRFTTKSHGTGMGLAMGQAITRQYGGEVYVGDSEWGGASFDLVFPEP